MNLKTTPCLYGDQPEGGEGGMGIWWREEVRWGSSGGRRASEKEKSSMVE
jgi:hypothetical protein